MVFLKTELNHTVQPAQTSTFNLYTKYLRVQSHIVEPLNTKLMILIKNMKDILITWAGMMEDEKEKQQQVHSHENN